MKAEHLRKSENTYFTVASQTIFSFGRHAQENKKRRQKLGMFLTTMTTTTTSLVLVPRIKFYKIKF